MEIQLSTATRVFEHDYPGAALIDQIHDEQLLVSAVEAYRFFYPTVSAEALFEGNRQAGIEDGKALMLLSAGPRHVVFTANSDTPYASGVLDLEAAGPMVIELPPGPLIGLVDDHHQRWVVDMGIPGPDGGKGGRYLVLPPFFEGGVPDGYFTVRCATAKALLALRALPVGGDMRAALALLNQVAVYPLGHRDQALPFVDLTSRAIDGTPLRWETELEYWARLHAIIDAEPVLDEFRPMYGALAALGIEKGHPFAPDRRMEDVLVSAARIANDQMRVAAFASARADCLAWPDRRWEWVGLVPDDANFETSTCLDLEARERWFYQAIVTSPAMFRRRAGSGSLYWLAARDATGAYLDGGRTYKLKVPHPVPGSLFWSVTAYDARTRSQVQAPRDQAVIGSLGHRFVPDAAGNVELCFGPHKPYGGGADRWIQTVPGRGFFLYFRIYGPEPAAFDGSWRLGDLQIVEPTATTYAPIPAAITTPSVVDTAIGKLDFVGGVPTADTVARVYDHLDYTHAIEAFMNAMPAVSLYAMREGMRAVGVQDNQVLLFSGLVDASSLFLTANCDTVYCFTFLDLSAGPMVLEVPPGMLGVVDDMWFRWVTDVGAAGPDRGRGGRYLFVPPGYDGPVPEGGFHIACPATQHLLLLGRAFLVHDDPEPAAASIREGLKIYPYVAGGAGTSVAAFLAGCAPLAAASEPPPTYFVDGTGMAMNTIPPNDVTFFDLLDKVVQLEPASALDPELAGQFRALGIVKGKPFRPSPRRTAILSEAVALANAAARTLATSGRAEEGFLYYSPDSAWLNHLFVGGYDFSQPPPRVAGDHVLPLPDPHARALHSRTALFYVGTGISPAMCMRVTGMGSQYLSAFVDAGGHCLDGASTYRLVLPPNIPAAQFWSVTLYDNQTRSMLQTPQRFPRAGSQAFPSPAAEADPDGTTVLFFGPDRPIGVAAGNWIQTGPADSYFVLLRLYGPLAPFFTKAWRPSEIDRVRELPPAS